MLLQRRTFSQRSISTEYVGSVTGKILVVAKRLQKYCQDEKSSDPVHRICAMHRLEVIVKKIIEKLIRKLFISSLQRMSKFLR